MRSCPVSLTRTAGPLLAVAVAAGVAAGPAAADSGELRLTLPAPTAKRLHAQTVTLAATTPGDVSRRRVSLPVRRATIADSVALELSGTLLLRANGRSVGLRSLQATVGATSTRVTALIGTRRVAVLTARSTLVGADRATGTASATGSGVTLTAAARRAISTGLAPKARRAAGGGVGDRSAAPVVPARFGTLSLVAKGTGVPVAAGPSTSAASGTGGGDAEAGGETGAGTGAGAAALSPYTLLDCVIPSAAIEGAPPLTAPSQPAGETPAPTLSGALTGSGSITWGFKDSLTNYVLAGSGSVYGKGASGRFTFGGSSSYDKTGGRAVVTGGGSGVFCYPGHGFAIAVADPTVVVDGAASRIIATVTTYQAGQLVSGRTDLASLGNVSISAPVADGATTTVTITATATLTGEGAKVFAGFYGAGTALNNVTATASYPTPVVTPPTDPDPDPEPDAPDDDTSATTTP